jgi:hypothetical protein
MMAQISSQHLKKECSNILPSACGPVPGKLRPGSLRLDNCQVQEVVTPQRAGVALALGCSDACHRTTSERKKNTTTTRGQQYQLTNPPHQSNSRGRHQICTIKPFGRPLDRPIVAVKGLIWLEPFGGRRRCAFIKPRPPPQGHALSSLSLSPRAPKGLGGALLQTAGGGA